VREVAMAKTTIRFSLKKKLVILVVFIIVIVTALAAAFTYKGFTDINRMLYVSRSKELSATVAALVDAEQVKRVRDAVFTIHEGIENPVSSDAWGSPEFDDYVRNFNSVLDMDDYKEIFDQLLLIQDKNNLQSVYILMFEPEEEHTIYLVDASHDGWCAPGVFDDVMYDVDRAAMAHPEDGIEPDITNTDEYGWVVAAGSPIFDENGELVAFAAADISMDSIMSLRNRYLFIALASMGVMAVIVVLLSIYTLDKTVIKPIHCLSDLSERYWGNGMSTVQHEFAQLQIHTGDEIETLSNSMKQMEQNINSHIQELLTTTQRLISTQKYATEMDEAANVDALTKVRNKRAYDLEMERCDRNLAQGETNIGIGMIDLNFLKQTNDEYGHEYGDMLLQSLCQMICQVFKHSPVFRIGGDEFVVLLKHSDLEELSVLREQFDQSIEKAQMNANPWERVSAAVGYAVFDPETDKTMSDVFARADKLMYERKAAMKALRSA
jgi:diguanylate cyclase (GGDEF)-like protein